MQPNLNSVQTAVTAADVTTDPVSAADARYREKAIDAAVKFEGFFIARMLHQMRNSTREIAGEDSVFKDPVNRAVNACGSPFTTKSNRPIPPDCNSLLIFIKAL